MVNHLKHIDQVIYTLFMLFNCTSPSKSFSFQNLFWKSSYIVIMFGFFFKKQTLLWLLLLLLFLLLFLFMLFINLKFQHFKLKKQKKIKKKNRARQFQFQFKTMQEKIAIKYEFLMNNFDDEWHAYTTVLQTCTHNEPNETS